MNQIAPQGGIHRPGSTRLYSKAEARAAGAAWTPADAAMIADILLIGVDHAFDTDVLDRILYDNNRIIAALEAHPEIHTRIRTAVAWKRRDLTGRAERTQD